MRKRLDHLRNRFSSGRALAFLIGAWWISCTFNSIAWADQSPAGVQASALQESYQTDLFTGRATSSIPIMVPPGRQQMQPEVRLVYHSGGSNGWCGVGWELDLGGIQRDTRKGAPTYTSADVFTATLHGSVDPLVAIGNSEYRAKIDDAFRKYVFNGTSWEMWEKDGTHYFFGTTSASRIENTKGTFRWALDKVVDTHGNTVTITYTQDQGQLYPAQIRYTGNDVTGDQPTNTVDFILETRPDPIVSYRSGVKMVVSSRLKSVVVKANGEQVRRYELAYTQNQDLLGHSLLTGITVYGEDGTTALPPLILTYAQPPSLTLGSSSTWGKFWKPSSDDFGEPLIAWVPVTFDADGDGTTDAGMYKVFGSLPSFIDSEISLGLSTTSTFDIQHWPYSNPIHISHDKELTGSVLQGDFNGDGLADIVEQVDSNGTWNVALAELYLYIAKRWIRFSKTTWISGFGIGSDGWKVFAGDFNGDGLTDLAQVRVSSGIWTVQVALSNGSTGFLPPINWLTSATGSGEWLTGDFNGDGLADLCLADTATGQRKIFVSNGTGFLDDGVWLSGWGTGLKPLAVDVNGDGYTDALTYDSSSGQWNLALSDGIRFISVGTWVSGLGQGSNQTPVLGDFNGDGLMDAAACNLDTGVWVVATSAGLPFTPLVQVDNGRGGSTTVTYRMYLEGSPVFLNLPFPYLPFPIPVVDSVTVSDGMGHGWRTQYTYSRSLYSAKEREWRGFASVGVTDAEGRTEGYAFRQDDILKGRLISRIARGTMDPSLVTVSLQESYNWTSSTPYPGVTALFLESTGQSIVDANQGRQVRWTQFEYDLYGNVTMRWDKGKPDPFPANPGSLSDDTITYFSYAYNTEDWILDKPYIQHTYDVAFENGQYVAKNLLSRADLYYDGSEIWKTSPTKGNLTRAIRWLNTKPPHQASPTARYGYDPYGNQTLAKEHRGNGIWSIVTTEYNPATHTFPVAVTNPLGYVLQSTYDPKTGNLLTSTDPNGAVTIYQYDPLGRLIAVVGPMDSADKAGTTIAYDTTSVPNRVTTMVRVQPGGDAVQESLSFLDGLGRVIEVKTEANDPTQQVVSQVATYSSRGEAIEQYLPFYTAKSNSYAVPDATLPKRTFAYDALGHAVRVIEPDGRSSTTEYGYLAVIQINPKGQRRISRMDAFDRLIEVQEYQQNVSYLTDYRYDPLGRLIQVRDAMWSSSTIGNISTMTYDSLGRKLTMDDPDMGHWEYAYDLVGNLIQQKDAKGQILAFTYDLLNRQIAKNGPGISVTYTYDTGTNGIGRLSKVTDNSGSTEFSYDVLGREIKTIKTVDGTSYIVERAYDALGRLTNLSYPDGEVVSYTYGPQGVKTVASAQTAYVQSMAYTATGQIATIIHGDGLATNYTYDSNTLWLKDLTTGSGSRRIQDFSYRYDPVGNVTDIADRVHTATQTFLYDDLNRLTRAAGSYGTQMFTYDTIGNLTEKNGVFYTYGAGPAGPHAVTAGSNGFSAGYDANGNMITRTDNGLGATYEYDAENRLVKVTAARTIHTTASIALQTGWNFVGLPVAPDSTAIKDVMGSLSFGTDYDQVNRFNPSTQTFEHFVNDPAYNQFDTMELGKGYLIYVTNPAGVTLTVSGQTSSSSNAVPITSNWNLIGSPTLDSEPIQQVLNNLALDTDYSQLSRYNSATQTHQDFTSSQADFTTVEKGLGYWLYGLRAATWTLRPSTFVTTFAYDGDGRRVKKTDRFGTTTYIGDFYEIRGSKTRKAIYVGSEQIAEKSSTGELSFLHHDHLGSASVVTDAAGQIVQRLEYTPYGEIAVRSGPDTTTRRFTGKEFDDTTGLYYYGARYYDPTLGRFIQPDTLVSNPSDPQDLNRYSYAGNNPVNFTDPTGHFKLKDFLKSFVGAAIGFFAPPLAPIMTAFELFQGIRSGGNAGSILGGFAGGLLGESLLGGIGKGLALGISSSMGSSAFSFTGGAFIGAVEFGFSGFGAGLGSSLGSGASFSEALESGGRGAAFGAGIGAAIQGSYLAGWQDFAHGLSVEAVAGAQLSHGMDLSGFNQLSRTLEQRRSNPRGVYLHGTDFPHAMGIRMSRSLSDGSWVTLPGAVDSVTGKAAINLNPADYQRFTSITPPKGTWFALVVAPKSSVQDRGLAGGGAPQWQIYGENKAERVFPNSN